MSVVVRSRSGIAALAGSSRGIATSSVLLAAAKGKAAKSSAPKKKASSFAKKTSQKTGGGGGGSASGITLRYSMARDPPDLSDFPRLHPESLIPDHVGRPTTFPRQTYEALKSFGLPARLKKELDSPGGAGSVIRECTLELAGMLDKVKARGGADKGARWILTGERGSGKSVLLFQSASYALESGWIVLYVPSATEWINSSSPYVYSPTTQTFHQPALASKLLNHLSTVNDAKLGTIALSEDVSLGNGQMVQKGKTVADLVKMGRDEGVAVRVLEAVFDVLGKRTSVPVLVAIDDAQALFSRSSYRTPDDEPVESYHLSTPLLFLDIIAGRRLFTGALLTSLSHTTPTHPLTPTLLSALSLPTTHPVNPYTPLEPVHLTHAQSLTPIPVTGLSTKEAGGMVQLFARKGWASGGNTGDEAFMANLISAGGNPGQLARGLSRQLTP